MFAMTAVSTIKVCVGFCLVASLFSFVPSPIAKRVRTIPPMRERRSFRGGHHEMALTPVGPFSPFRSSSGLKFDEPMEQLRKDAPDFASEMTKVQLDLQLDQKPDPDRLLPLANRLEKAVFQWQQLLKQLRESNDFQCREYAYLADAHLASFGGGFTVEDITATIQWQAACLKALALNLPPPMPPAAVNLSKMMAMNAVAASGGGRFSMTAMLQSSSPVTARPFDLNDPILTKSPLVKDEYEKLIADHEQWIELGSKYGEFDPLGKLAFLDRMDALQDRWDVFLARFSLMGALNRQYVHQCDQFLQSMGLDERQYRQLLQQCHDKMRREAELERP